MTFEEGSNPRQRLRCPGRIGAVLILGGSATRRRFGSRLHIVSYLRRHFLEWLAFVEDKLGPDIDPSTLYFISGTTKTSAQWANIVYIKDSYDGYMNIAGGGFRPLHEGPFQVSMSNATNARVFARVGLHASPAGSEHLPANQCIFVNYYGAVQLKATTFSNPIRASQILSDFLVL
ncbi:hypothetical protein OH76DRAFT_1394760 [Lentinus brumalis]|uniref:Uncharacterized protein n=1 Tax=Lentinus brumalis TaxID=2498619 RepID=A0A371DWX1_9APHY|nr:hypothetical protein OH76DRAFT_1394760 [Polyporus brumalis]